MPFWTMNHWMGWGWWWFPFHGLFSLLFVIAVVAVVLSLARSTGRHGPYRYGRSAALDVLEQRYARGEIQREEYLQKKQDLGG